MTGKIKWDYIPKEKKEVVFKDFKNFQDQRVNDGFKNKEILERLFNYYNDYVSLKYPRVNSSMSCGKCVNTIVKFFTNALQESEGSKSFFEGGEDNGVGLKG